MTRHRSQWNERGAALLSVLLLVAIMAVIAATALDRLLLATRLTGASIAVDQARAFALAAESIALRRVGDIVARDPAKLTRQGDWLDRDIALPLPVGSGTMRVTDAANCFNLNALVAETAPGLLSRRQVQVGQLAELLRLTGAPADQTQAIAGASADWIDSDTIDGPFGGEDAAYRGGTGGLPANRRLADISEWRAVRGVTPALFERMRPWLCALPTSDPLRLNVNTMLPDRAPLIAMLMPGQIPIADAQAALAARPADGYGSTTRFWESGPLRAVKPPPDVAEQVGVTSRWLWLRSRVELGDGDVTAHSLIDLNAGRAAPTPGQSPVVVARRWGED